MCRMFGVLVVTLLVPGPSWAQPSLDNVGALLKGGEEVVVVCERAATGCDGGRVRGRLSTASSAGLELTVGERMLRIPGERILKIERPKDSNWNGFGIGMAAGAGIGAAIGIVAALSEDDSSDASEPWALDLSPSGSTMFLGFALLGTAIGSGVGAVVDSARGGPTVVFERATSLPSTHVGLFTSRGAAGLQMQLRF